jgi:DNA transposition AAA+ family ATPase
MEKTYNPALIQRTQRYMETHSISQNQFAAKVNLSSAALSSYLNQKYKGSVEAVERQAHKAGIAAAEARLKKHTAVYADFSKGLAPGQQA